MIELFKEGTSRNYKGITCDSMLVNEFGFEHYLEEGWVFDPNDLYKDDGETKKETAETATPKVTTAKPKTTSENLRAKLGTTTTKSGSSAKK